MKERWRTLIITLPPVAWNYGKCMETAEAEALDYLKSSRLNPESLMQTDGGVIAADSNEVNGDAGPEDLREEEAFRDFITETHAEDYEAQEGWYRWTYTVKEIDVERIVETLKKRYEATES